MKAEYWGISGRVCVCVCVCVSACAFIWCAPDDPIICLERNIPLIQQVRSVRLFNAMEAEQEKEGGGVCSHYFKPRVEFAESRLDHAKIPPLGAFRRSTNKGNVLQVYLCTRVDLLCYTD